MYTSEDIRKVQLRLLEMAVAIRDVLEKYNDIGFVSAKRI